MTQAGIHADGLLKDEEIYTIFDTKKILKKPSKVVINSHSGLAGIAHWINNQLDLHGDERIDKKDPRVTQLKEWVDSQYSTGRVTVIYDEELIEAAQQVLSDLFGQEEK